MRETEDGGRQQTSQVLVAWEGIGALVPGTWSIVAASGTEEKGYLRADGPHEESAEFRWQKTKRQPDLDLVAEEYLKQVEKFSKKKKADFEGDLQELKRAPREKPVDLKFTWQSDRTGSGRLIWCKECSRTVITQVSVPLGAPVDELAARILPTVRDHSIDGAVDWGLYGLSFRVPRSLRLNRHRLMSGFLSVNFFGGPGRVIVERWGLAEMLLADGGLLTWHESEYLSELKDFKGTVSAAECGDHEALETEGFEGGFRRAKALVRAFGLPGRADRFASLVWHCPMSNRIVGVRAYGRNPLDMVRSIAASVRCHNA